MKSLPPIVPAPAARSEKVTFRVGPRGESQLVRTIIDPLIPEQLAGAAA